MKNVNKIKNQNRKDTFFEIQFKFAFASFTQGNLCLATVDADIVMN